MKYLVFVAVITLLSLQTYAIDEGEIADDAAPGSAEFVRTDEPKIKIEESVNLSPR